jgi:hypothetical protein
MNRKILTLGTSVAIFASALGFTATVLAADSAHTDTKAEAEIRALYKQLIDDENAHDIAAVRRIVWKSPSPRNVIRVLCHRVRMRRTRRRRWARTSTPPDVLPGRSTTATGRLFSVS